MLQVYSPTPASVNGPVSDMDRIETFRTAMARIRRLADERPVRGMSLAQRISMEAEMALDDDDRLAAVQNAEQIAYAHQQARRALDLATEAESLPW